MSSSQIPTVSVIMSVHNGAEYLNNAIDSILGQTYRDFEFIIFDDCSDDDSWQILKSYADKDSRIVLHQNVENLGLTKSLNKALRRASGKYIARQDDDDISLPQRLELQVDFLKKNETTVLVSSNIEVINSSGEVLRLLDRSCPSILLKWYLLFYNHIGGHSQVMFVRDTVLELGGYNEDFRYAQDYELWCRLAQSESELFIVPKVLLHYRQHAQSISSRKKTQQKQNCLQQVQLNIFQLLPKEKLKLEIVQELVHFWTANIDSKYRAHRPFPSACNIFEITIKNNALKEEFANKYSSDASDYKDVIRLLDEAIEDNFFAWFKSPLMRSNGIFSKFLLAKYCFSINPKRTPEICSALLFRLPIGIVNLLITKFSYYRALTTRIIFQRT